MPSRTRKSKTHKKHTRATNKRKTTTKQNNKVTAKVKINVNRLESAWSKASMASLIEELQGNPKKKEALAKKIVNANYYFTSPAEEALEVIYTDLAIYPWNKRNAAEKRTFAKAAQAIRKELIAEVEDSVKVALETENEYSITIESVKATFPTTISAAPSLTVIVTYTTSDKRPSAAFLLKDLRASFEHWYNAGDNGFKVASVKLSSEK